MPITKKNIAISASSIQYLRSCAIERSPTLTESSVLQKLKYESLKGAFDQISAATPASSSSPALPDSVARNWRIGFATWAARSRLLSVVSGS